MLFFLYIPMRKILLIALLLVSSVVSVTATEVDPIAQTKALLDQYSARVKFLETENALLREEMRKAGITIPLSLFSGSIQTTTNTTVIPPVILSTGSATATGVLTTNPTLSGEVSLVNIEKTYWASYAGFIKRIISEWDKVRDAYAMPKTAYIGWYEFVASGALDHVFVDITYTWSLSATGMYDAKILYQFDKTTYARKLIWFFEYNPATGYYVTKTGKNTFAGVKRTWVADPRGITTTIPTTVTGTATATGTVTTTTPPTGTTTVTYADIETAYAAKRFLSVISLSNSWLTANSPTLDVLRIRYRTYFIIAKYTEALAEIEKIRSIGQLSSAVACEGYVIATYAKNTTLADSYKITCNKK